MCNTQEYKGYTIKINIDEFAESPREWNNMGTMICKHNRYLLGDVKPSEDYVRLGKSVREDMAMYFYRLYYENMPSTIEKYVGYANDYIEEKGIDLIFNWIDKNIISLPLYLYDHSIITINTKGFSCPWDSGQVGFIYVDINKIKKEFNWKILTKERKNKIKSMLKEEVKIYDDYIRGDVYRYNIPKIDSCGNFYGNNFEENGLLENARSDIDYYIQEKKEKRFAQLKTFIINKVSFSHRQQLLCS